MEEMIKALNAESESERCFAAQDLGYENQCECLDPLIDRLKIEKSRMVGEAIVVALGKLNRGPVVEAVVRLFENEDPFLRNAAISILKSKGVEAVPALLERLEHQDPDIRKFSLDTLTVIDADLSNAIYGKALEDPDVNVRITAVEYVGLHRKFQFKTAVEKALFNSKSTMLSSVCLQTLLVIGDEISYHLVLNQYPKEKSVPAALKDLWWRFIGLHFKERFKNRSSGEAHAV